MTAGAWALDHLSASLYRRLDQLGARLADGLRGAASKAGVSLHVNQLGSMLTPFFSDHPVTDYASATATNTEAYATFFRGMLARGIYPPPSQFEAWFVSGAHTTRDIDRTVRLAREALAEAGDMMRG